MTVTYEVGGSSSNGKLDIDFYVSRVDPAKVEGARWYTIVRGEDITARY